MDDTATVLLVDDDPGLADTAAAFIERENDAITTTTASTPAAALDRFEAGDVDCVVSDYNMSDMDGLALFESITEHESGLPFILFTGKGSEEVASEAISLGVTDYLQKDTGTDQYAVLANRIENAIEAQRAEQRLDRAEERYQDLVESAPAGILITSLEDSIVYANEAAAAFIGAEESAELLGESTLGLVHPDDEARLRGRWQGSREGNPQEAIEERFVGFDGETRHAVVSSTPVVYEGERAVQSILTDVTDQRRAERELNEERAFIDRALDSLDDTFFVTDPSGQLSRWNDQFTAVTGYADEEIGEMYPQEFVTDADEERIADAFGEVIETGRTTVEVTIETKRGEHIPHELVGTTMTDEDGTIVGVCGTGRDITERREREHELERYERLVETVDDALYTVDGEGRFTFVNESFVGLTGYDRATLLGADVSILKDEATVERFEDGVREMLRGEHDETYIEFALRRADGEVVPCEDHMVLRTDDDEYAGVAGVIRDTTERKQRKRELERYETAIEAAPVGVFVLDPDATIEWANDRAASSVGYTVAEIAGTSFDVLIEDGMVGESATEKYATALRELLSDTSSRPTSRYEVDVTDPKRGERIHRIHVSPLPYDESFRGAVLVAEDVTERKQRDEQLEAQAAAMDISMDGMAILDEAGEYTYVNQAHATIYGYETPDDLLGESWRELYERAERERIETTALSAIEEAGSWRGETAGRRRDGTTFPQDLSLTLLDDGGIVCVIRDITEHKRRENTLERERDRLRALFENVADPVYRYENDGDEARIRAVNPAFERTFGYDEEAVLGERISEVIVPSNRVDEYEEIVAKAGTGDPLNTEVERETAFGQRTFLLRNASMTEAAAADPTAGYAIYTDITERKQRERRLERYETALRAAPVGVFVLDAEGTITWCNDRAASFMGHAASDLIEESFASLVDEGVVAADSTDEYAETLRSLLTSDNDRTADEYEIPVTPAGASSNEQRILRAHVSLLPYDETFEGAVLVAEDVTERKRRKRALEREHDRFATLFENIPDPAVFVNHENGEATVKAINEAFESTFGYAAEAAIGASLNDLIVPPENNEEATTLDRAVMDGERVIREVTRCTDAGEYREFLFRNATIDGDATEAFGVYTDITTQKRRERVLADLHDRTLEMMETTDPAAVAAIAVDAAKSVLDLSVCALWLHDDDAETLRPVAATDESHAVIEELPIYEPGNSLSWDAFVTGEPRTYDDVRDADSHNPETPIHSEMILLLGEYGVMNVGNTTEGAFDDTDETLARLLATNVEAAFERAARERERTAHRRLLERENERLEAFAGVVSHDLRNPLTVATGRLELLDDEFDSQHIPPIVDALERMDSLIEECLTFARQGEVVTDPTTTDVGAIANLAWQTVETGETDLTVEEIDAIEADDDRLRTVFENLFRNAMEHGDATAIRVGPLADGPGFFVADDGSGIPDSERDSVFDRGYSTSQAGSGLGLAIVDTLIDAHGWAVTLADDGPGARFEVAFEPSDPLPVEESND